MITNRWARLSQDEKAELLGIYARGGWVNLEDIINDYNNANTFEGGGKTVRQTWEERTGKSWEEVGDYYKEYDKTTKGNIALLNRLNAGEFDYLANPEPIEPERSGFNFDINWDSIKSGVDNAVNQQKEKTVADIRDAQRQSIMMTDVMHYLAYDQKWRTSEADDYVFNDKQIKSDLDFTQKAVPEEKMKLYGTHIDPKRITEWDDYQCASFLTNWRLRNGSNRKESYQFVDKNNYRGDAWTWLKNAQGAADKGADVSVDYNMYTENNFTGKENKAEVIRRTRQLASTQQYKDRMMASIRPGSVVTLLYPNSSKFEKAAESYKSGKGTTMSTHIGDVVELDGKLYVRDNVGGAKTNYKGHIHYRPLEEVINGRDSDGVLITGIANYGKTNVMGKYYDTSEFGFKTADETSPLRTQSAVSYRMMDAIERNKDVLIEKYGIPENMFRPWMQLALAFGVTETYMQQGELAKQESGKYLPSRYLLDHFGLESHKGEYATSNDIEYAKKALTSPLKGPAEWISGLFTPRDGSKARKWAESKGVTNIKYRGDRGDGRPLFTEKELEDLGLKEHMYDERIMESPEVSGVMSMIAIKKKYDEIQEIIKDLPDSIKNDDYLVGSLLFLSWNQGTKNIRTTADRIKNGGDPNDMYEYMTASYVPGVDYYFRRFVDMFKAAEQTIPSDSEFKNMSKEDIISMQENLVELGYLPKVINGKNQIDGIIGKNTKAAIERFKKDKEKKSEEKEGKKEKKESVKKQSYTPFDSNSFANEMNRERGWGVLAPQREEQVEKPREFSSISSIF